LAQTVLYAEHNATALAVGKGALSWAIFVFVWTATPLFLRKPRLEFKCWSLHPDEYGTASLCASFSLFMRASCEESISCPADC